MTHKHEEARKAAFTQVMGAIDMPDDASPDFDQWLFDAAIDAYEAKLAEAGYVRVPNACLLEVKRCAERDGDPRSDWDGGAQSCAQELWDYFEPFAMITASHPSHDEGG